MRRVLVLATACLALGCIEEKAPEGEPEPEPGAEPEVREPERHRPVATACDDMRTPGNGAANEGGACTSDADCVDGRNGRCTSWRFTQCTYDACLTDADCANDTGGGVCGCSGSAISDANVCLGGDCRTNADCASGYCSPSFGFCGDYDGVVAMYCHTADDECIDDADCEGPGAYCAFLPERGLWGCSDSQCLGK